MFPRKQVGKNINRLYPHSPHILSRTPTSAQLGAHGLGADWIDGPGVRDPGISWASGDPGGETWRDPVGTREHHELGAGHSSPKNGMDLDL